MSEEDLPSFEEMYGDWSKQDYRELRNHVIKEQKMLVERGILDEVRYPDKYEDLAEKEGDD